jgi:hypothetical protein
MPRPSFNRLILVILIVGLVDPKFARREVLLVCEEVLVPVGRKVGAPDVVVRG